MRGVLGEPGPELNSSRLSERLPSPPQIRKPAQFTGFGCPGNVPGLSEDNVPSALAQTKSNDRLVLAETGRSDNTSSALHAVAFQVPAEICFDPFPECLSFPLRSSQLRRSRSISLEAIVSEVESTADTRAIFSNALIAGSYGFSTHMVALAIRACPVLLRNEELRFAAAFFCVSMHDFYVSPGGLRDALDDGDRIPTRAAELASWEASYQNSYKCIEAVIGDPPRDESRYRAKLLAAGLDPEEEVGYQTKAKVADVIREMNRLRDTRVAHGSTLRGIKLSPEWSSSKHAPPMSWRLRSSGGLRRDVVRSHLGTVLGLSRGRHSKLYPWYAAANGTEPHDRYTLRRDATGWVTYRSEPWCNPQGTALCGGEGRCLRLDWSA